MPRRNGSSSRLKLNRKQRKRSYLMGSKKRLRRANLRNRSSSLSEF